MVWFGDRMLTFGERGYDFALCAISVGDRLAPREKGKANGE